MAPDGLADDPKRGHPDVVRDVLTSLPDRHQPPVEIHGSGLRWGCSAQGGAECLVGGPVVDARICAMTAHQGKLNILQDVLMVPGHPLHAFSG